MRPWFVVVAACASAPAPPPPAPAPAAAPAVGSADAGPAASPPVALGGACLGSDNVLTCTAGTRCMPALPDGYCTSPCGLLGKPCEGACVETSRSGELCMAACGSDADCRVADGYVCDRAWHACSVPGFAALVPPRCPALPREPDRDAAFAASEPWSSSASPGVYQFEPAAALTDDGGVVAVYISRAAIFDGNALGVARIDGRGRATLDTALTAPDRRSQFDPWLARGRDGTLYAVWYAFDGRDERGEIVLATSRDAGATWSTPQDVHDPADCGSSANDCLDKPMVAVGPRPGQPSREAVYAFYAADAAGGLRVRASLDRGATFGKPATVTEGIYGNAVVAPDGAIHVVTLRGGPVVDAAQPRRVDYAVSVDGGATWKTRVVSGGGEAVPFFFSNPSVAVDARRGWVYVAYADLTGDGSGAGAVWDIALAASHDGGATWKRTGFGDGCGMHMVPDLALDPTTGTLHVAWYDSEGAVGRFAHGACSPGLATCARRGAINSVPFAALSTERHGAKWIGEYESLIVDDKRRVLHAVWTEPVAEAGRVVSRIFHAAAKL